MSIKNIKIKKDGGTPEVEFIIGQPQVGVYRSYLWDSQNVPKKIGHGNNADDVIDKYVLEKPNEMEHKTLSWEVTIQAPASTPGQLYSLQVIIRQDGKIAPGGAIGEAGPMNDNTKVVVGFARFKLV